jgi:hypothetical protein
MTNETKQTAVDLMFQRAMFVLPMFSIDARRGLKETYEQAKEMEKKQAQRTFEESRLTNAFVGFKHKTFEDYYNETYGGNK